MVHHAMRRRQILDRARQKIARRTDGRVHAVMGDSLDNVEVPGTDLVVYRKGGPTGRLQLAVDVGGVPFTADELTEAYPTSDRPGPMLLRVGKRECQTTPPTWGQIEHFAIDVAAYPESGQLTPKEQFLVRGGTACFDQHPTHNNELYIGVNADTTGGSGGTSTGGSAIYVVEGATMSLWGGHPQGNQFASTYNGYQMHGASLQPNLTDPIWPLIRAVTVDENGTVYAVFAHSKGQTLYRAGGGSWGAITFIAPLNVWNPPLHYRGDGGAASTQVFGATDCIRYHKESGCIYMWDTWNAIVWRFHPPFDGTGLMERVAGVVPASDNANFNGTTTGYGGPATSASLVGQVNSGFAVAPDGTMYISQMNTDVTAANCIARVGTDGILTSYITNGTRQVGPLVCDRANRLLFSWVDQGWVVSLGDAATVTACTKIAVSSTSALAPRYGGPFSANLGMQFSVQERNGLTLGQNDQDIFICEDQHIFRVFP